MASQDHLLNIWSRMLDDDNQDPNEFAKLDAIFNSQETREEIKTNVFALKQKFRTLQLSYASHVNICRQDSEAKAQEMDNLMTRQQDLEEDVRAAHEYMQELQNINTMWQMKTSMGNDKLWNNFETINKVHYRTRMELEIQSDLLSDYHVHSATIQARNAYLEDKCVRLLEQLGNGGATSSSEKQENDWRNHEPTYTDQTIAELTEATPSTSTNKTDMKENAVKNLEMQLNAAVTENEKELNTLKNKVEEVSREKIYVDNHMKKILEEQCVLQLEMDATKENLLMTQKKLKSTTEELLESNEKLIQLERNTFLNLEKAKEELSNLQTENENLLIKINNMTTSKQFLENYYKEKFKTTMSTIEGVDHPILDKLITSHNKSKSENELMSKRFAFCSGKDKGKMISSSSSNICRSIICVEHECDTHLYNTTTTVRSQKKEITKLTAECQDFMEEIGALKNDKSNFEELNWSLGNQVEILLKEKEKAIAEVETLKMQLTTFQKASKPDDAYTKVPREDYDALLNRYKEIQAELTAKISPQQSAQPEIVEEKPKLSMEESAGSTSKTQNAKKSGQTGIVASNVDLELLNQKLSRIEQELKDSKRKDNSLLGEKRTFVRILLDSFNSKANVQSRIIQLNNEIKIMQSKISEFEEKSNSQVAESDFGKEQGHFDEKLHNSLAERYTLFETITEWNGKSQMSGEGNDGLDNPIKKLEEGTQNKSLKTKIDHESENSLHIKDDSLSRQLNKLNNLVTELTFERDELKLTNEECSKKIKSLKAGNHDLLVQKNILELRLRNINMEVQSSNKSYTIRIKTLEDEKRSLAGENLLLQTTLQTTEDKLLTEKSAHLKCLKSVECELTLENDVLESKNKVLCSQIKYQEELLSKERAMVDKFKKQLILQQDVINNQEKRTKKLKAEYLKIDKLQTEREYKEFDIQDCLEKIRMLNSSLDEAGNTIREYQAENSDIKSKLNDTEMKLIDSLSNANRMRDLVEKMNKKTEAFKCSIIECARHLGHAQNTFAQTRVCIQDEEQPNSADTLSTIITKLVNIANDAADPMTTESGVGTSEVLANFQLEENKFAWFDRQMTELEKEYAALFKGLRTTITQNQSEATSQECAKCLKQTKRIFELKSHIDSITALIRNYRTHCDYLTKRITQLRKEKQVLQAHQSQLSEPQYTTDLKNKLSALKNDYDKLLSIARVRLILIQELKSKLGYNPCDAQGCSTDP